MNRLNKELRRRGIVGDNEMDVITGRSSVEYSAEFVGFENGLMVIAYYCNVLDNMFILYDRNFKRIGSQAQYLDNMEHWNFGNANKWDVQISF